MVAACSHQHWVLSQRNWSKPDMSHLSGFSFYLEDGEFPPMRQVMQLKTACLFGLAGLALALSSCQRETPRPQVNGAALPTMERVALGANSCWFKSNDPAFKSYRLAPELNSFSGRPRILIVPRNSPEARPLLVVQAEGNPAKLAAFGPLLDGGLNSRISADVNRWATGSKSCS